MISKYEVKLEDIKGKIGALLHDIIKAHNLSYQAFEDGDSAKYMQAVDTINNLSTKGSIIDNEIVKTFALFGPEANELRTLVAFLKMTNEIVRIGEGVSKYARRMKEHLASECNIEPLRKTIAKLHKSSVDALEKIQECFENMKECEAEEYFRRVMVEESISDDLFSILEKEIMNHIMDERELSIEYVKVLGTLRKLERVCDRSVNIASLLVYAKNGGDMNNHL